ncbi:MAG: prepilin-type N-terminal cleavage/methylation domain-containing protein [Candidatus Pacebacteria bacterium]|nr:prepilin-type N-terminal cleavage/methylation domain-containing protein [Candidatus Paceibacterota bacterium]
MSHHHFLQYNKRVNYRFIKNPKTVKSSAGFTLIEILVAIGILTILSGMGWLALSNLQPSLKLSAVARDLTSDLRYSQQLAVTEQINYGVRFSSSTAQYYLDKFGTTTQTLFSKSLPSGISFCQITGLSDGEAAIFNPYGAVLLVGSVCLSNDKGQTKIIEIKPSGFVKIQQ